MKVTAYTYTMPHAPNVVQRSSVISSTRNLS